MPYISVSTGPNALRGANPTLGPLRVVDAQGRHVGPPAKRADLRRPAPSSVPSAFVPPGWAQARANFPVHTASTSARPAFLRGLGEYRDMEMYNFLDQSMSGSGGGCVGCLGATTRVPPGFALTTIPPGARHWQRFSNRGVRGLGGGLSTSLGLPDTVAGINIDWIIYGVVAYFAYSLFLSKSVGKARRAYSRARRKASDRDRARAEYESKLADIG